ncbi:MAG: twin transmembrane helix small protein [Parvibaculaceae bacterium]
MTGIFNFLIPAALAAVVIVLLAGLWNMMRNGSASRSQTLMRWRVGLQFVAVIVVMAAFYLTTA